MLEQVKNTGILFSTKGALLCKAAVCPLLGFIAAYAVVASIKELSAGRKDDYFSTEEDDPEVGKNLVLNLGMMAGTLYAAYSNSALANVALLAIESGIVHLLLKVHQDRDSADGRQNFVEMLTMGNIVGGAALVNSIVLGR